MTVVPVPVAVAAPRLNPVAKLATAVVIAVALILSLDWVSASTALVLELVLIVVLRIPLRPLLSRSAALLLAATLTAVTILLYGQVSGTVHWHFLLVTVSDGSITLAAATFLRVLAIALPSVALFIDTDPTDLADALGQILRLPARFVLGALAGLRLVGLLGDDWRTIGHARRARGVGDHARIRRTAGQAFALLVSAIRRGSTLATAMEARGLGAHPTRTWARPSVLTWRDGAVVAAGLVIAAVAITVSIAAGHWNFIATP
ncbi:energy-coupling factor transporter transmembrane component T family protein [Mycolicibacterium sp. CBM1]